MTVEFRLVDIGEGLTEAEIVRWLVAVGDITGDARADVIVRSTRTNRLWTLRGIRGGFAPRRAFAAVMSRFDIAG